MITALTVSQAQDKLLNDVPEARKEAVDLVEADGRVLASDLVAGHDQPPFHCSAMDGFAFIHSDLAGHSAGAACQLEIIGQSRAGVPFEGVVQTGQAVRIFTGAVVPKGADTVIPQEMCDFNEGGTVTIVSAVERGVYIRPRGYDFKEGSQIIRAGERLHYRHLALIASMNINQVLVSQKPRVAILATGDELCLPGTAFQEGQIASSIPYGMAAMINAAGGEPHLLGIGRDEREDLREKIALAQGFDILVTIGGASVGDHDLVQAALLDAGMTLDFWRIQMRPGKPLMVGRLGAQRVIGVPGNPVSALICTKMFTLPLIRLLQGERDFLPKVGKLPLGAPLGANGPRQHYMRAKIQDAVTGLEVVALEDQDSSLQALFARANALIVRPPDAPAAPRGALVEVLRLDDL